MRHAVKNYGPTEDYTNYNEADPAFDEVIARFGADPSPKLRRQVARALHNKAYCFEKAGDCATAIEVVDELNDQFTADVTPAVPRIVADGLSVKARALTRLGRPKEAVSTYDDIIERYGSDTDPDLREIVALALWFKADLRPRATEAGQSRPWTTFCVGSATRRTRIFACTSSTRSP